MLYGVYAFFIFACVFQMNTTVYRVWGGGAQKYSHWVSPNNYGADARRMLALPPENTAQYTLSFTLLEDMGVLAGKAVRQLEQSGGGIQWWCPKL